MAPLQIDAGIYQASLLPPYRSMLAEAPDVEAIPIASRPQLMAPADPQRHSGISMDGAAMVEADVLQIDFVAEEFNRGATMENCDPPIALIFALANGFIARLRTLGRAFSLDYIRPETTTWRLEYLNDDGSELEPAPPLIRARVGASWTMSYVGLSPELWRAISELPADYEPPAADELMLDAVGRLPQVGAAVVLGYAALETRIEAALDELVRLTWLKSDLWKWITIGATIERSRPSESNSTPCYTPSREDL